MDYYKILCVERKASHEEIAQAYRVLAVKYHPMKTTENMDSNQRTFSQVCEAYEVLSNPDLKNVYDKYGKLGLKMVRQIRKTENASEVTYIEENVMIYSKHFSAIRAHSQIILMVRQLEKPVTTQMIQMLQKTQKQF